MSRPEGFCWTAKSGYSTKLFDFSPLVAEGCIGLCLTRRCIQLREAVRKFVAMAALMTLLLPGVSALAKTLSAAGLPACCNTAYCPVHHRQKSNLQKDKANCAAIGMPGQDDCSMRACDAAPNPIVGTAAFVMIAPIALRGPAVAEAAPASVSRFFPFVATIPLTPPPRSFPS
jgi:hypothetical protein